MADRDLSHRLAAALGTCVVGVQERAEVVAAASVADTWGDLPADVRHLVEEIEVRPGWLDDGAVT